MLYGFIRFGAVPFALIGWIFYQIFKKKKTFAELQPDIMTIVVLFVVWGFIYYQFMH